MMKFENNKVDRKELTVNNKRAKQKIERKKETNLNRNEAKLLEKPLILIVCEGENTEPSYFKQFQLSSAEIIGTGFNTLTLVNRAIKLSKEKKYDQVWCVFDADPKPENSKHADNFNEAINLAESKKLSVAYSNQAFEYWLILHFDDHQGGGMNRADYDTKLNKLLKPFNLTYDGKGTKK